MGLAFVYLGVSQAIPQIGGFGVLWTLGALAATVLSFYNAFSSRGVATEIIDVPSKTGEGERPQDSVETRLVRLEDLKARGLISPSEYEQRRAAILDEL